MGFSFLCFIRYKFHHISSFSFYCSAKFIKKRKGKKKKGSLVYIFISIRPNTGMEYWPNRSCILYFVFLNFKFSLRLKFSIISFSLTLKKRSNQIGNWLIEYSGNIDMTMSWQALNVTISKRSFVRSYFFSFWML